MPDQSIMLQIRAREEQRAWDALDAQVGALLFAIDHEPQEVAEAYAFRAGLVAIAEAWRESADLYERAKGKGFKTAHVDPLRAAARLLDAEIKRLDEPRRAPLGELQPTSGAPAGATDGETYPPAECPNVAAKQRHAAHDWIGGPQGSQDSAGARGWRRCSGYVANDHPAQGLDALIADAAAAAERAREAFKAGERAREAYVGEHGPEVVDISAGERLHRIDLAPIPAPRTSVESTGDDVSAYLRGDVDSIPDMPNLGPSGVRDQTEPEPVDDPHPAAPATDPRDITAKETLVTAPPVPLLGQPGDAGPSYDHAWVPPGGVPATFAELLAPVPVAFLPGHVSHSQIETAAECDVKYRLQRLPRLGANNPSGMAETVEIPQWANIGGATFHAIVENVERVVQPGDPDPLHTIGYSSSEHAWRDAFDAEIQRIEASSPVPRARWRAANKGAEHEGWWRVNGPKMIERYLAARPAEPTAKLPALVGFDGPTGDYDDAIEIERAVMVPTGYGPVPYKAILDRVTVRRTDPDPAVAPTLVIRDYKTGRMPDDAQQLGEYANVLRLLGVPPEVRIVGTFFNARKGEWTKEVDLDAAYPADWFAYYVTTGQARRLALTQGPTPARPTSFCGGCPVRWACPVKTPRRPDGSAA